MRALLQRINKASVLVEGREISSIGPGLVVYACAMESDQGMDVASFADKIAKLRIFSDQDGKMNKSLLDVNGQCLLVSQFTLAADTKKGRRPSYDKAMKPDEAERLLEVLGGKLQALGITVKTGSFGADMQIELSCDGPVTIWLDSEK